MHHCASSLYTRELKVILLYQPFQNRTILCLALNLPLLSKVRCSRPKKFGRLPEGLLYTHQPLHFHNHYKRTIIPRSTAVLFYNTSITQKSVHRLIRQSLEQLHRKTGTQRRNNSTLPCSHYRKIKKQQ